MADFHFLPSLVVLSNQPIEGRLTGKYRRLISLKAHKILCYFELPFFALFPKEIF